MKTEYKDLESYGTIGNLETCALVGSDGSVDWLCLPYLESPFVFGALLDINAALHVGVARGRKHEGPKPMGHAFPPSKFTSPEFP